MKKVLIGLITYVVFIVIYLLQTNFFSWFTIGGVSPNLFIILAIFLGLFTSNYFAIILSVIMGLTIDFEVGKQFIGPTAIMLTIIVSLVAYLDKNFSKDSKITIILLVALGTIVYEVGYYVLNIFIFKFAAEISEFIKLLAIEMIYNVVLILLFYRLLRKLGSKVERIFKEKTLLTRYF